NAQGIPTNAIYGFLSMLLKILDENPDYIAISFDKAAPTFRHKEYKEYKAQRQKAPDELYQQMPLVKEVVKAFDIPIYEIDGFEADDVLATIAKAAEAKGIDVEILTGDLDTLQLVSDRIKIVTTKKGISDTVIYDEAQVKERFGLLPSQMIDYKGLKGDPSDNLPGVPGIGDKTATELLKEFGTLENVLKNIDKIKSKKIQEKLTIYQSMAEQCKYLATLITDVPIKMDFNHMKHTPADWSKIIPLFEKFEFRTLIKKYSGKDAMDLFSSIETREKQEEIQKNANYHTITEEKELINLLPKLTQGFAFDTETTSLESLNTKLVGISIAYQPHEAFYIPVGHDAGKQLPLKTVLNSIKPIFEDPAIPKYGQNIKFDAEVMYGNGIEVTGIAFDDMVAAYVLDPTEQRYGLKSLGAKYLGKKMIKIVELIGKGTDADTMAEVPIDLASDYACSDADITLQLVEILKKELKESSLEKLFEDIELPLVPVLTSIEEAGISIDSDKLNQMSNEMEHSLKDIEKNIYILAGEEFNINSPKQLQVILFEKLMLPAGKKTKTGASTDATVLEEMAPKYEIAKLLLDYRQLTKLKSTYIDVLPSLVHPKTGRIHTSFNQTITATGRLSSSNPNMQNIPAKGEYGKLIRSAFVPKAKDWSLLSADYSQIELRILAHLSEDPILINAFQNDQDIHKRTASEVFGVALDKVTPDMRDRAKTVNFGIIYGMSEFGLAKSLNIKKSEAANFIEKYFKKYCK
ncbi:MAG: DNA polymerase I, partial [bacterium]